MQSNTRQNGASTATPQSKRSIRDVVLGKLADDRKEMPRDRETNYRGDMHGGLIFASPTPAVNGNGKH